MIGFSVDKQDDEVSAVTVVSSAAMVRGECPGPDTTQDAVLTGMLKEFGLGLNDREARDILLGCLRDLSGSPAATLPELAFRLMRHRMSTRVTSLDAMTARRPGRAEDLHDSIRDDRETRQIRSA